MAGSTSHIERTRSSLVVKQDPFAAHSEGSAWKRELMMQLYSVCGEPFIATFTTHYMCGFVHTLFPCYDYRVVNNLDDYLEESLSPWPPTTARSALTLQTLVKACALFGDDNFGYWTLLFFSPLHDPFRAEQLQHLLDALSFIKALPKVLLCGEACPGLSLAAGEECTLLTSPHQAQLEYLLTLEFVLQLICKSL